MPLRYTAKFVDNMIMYEFRCIKTPSYRDARRAVWAAGAAQYLEFFLSELLFRHRRTALIYV